MKAINLESRRFGKLSVVEKTENMGTRTAWICICDCGNKKKVRTNDLLRGKTKSCGCEERKTHGNRRVGNTSPEYNSWVAMKSRCFDSNSVHYNRYGGRGITVCERWMSFENFLSDMGEKPTNNHSIERINNDGNYEPSNCKWASKIEQSRNRSVRKDNVIGISGVQMHECGKFQVRIAVNRKNIYVGLFDTLKEAVKARREAEQKYWKSSQ